MTSEHLRELYRARWRRARAALNLLDCAADGFATAGLGGNVPDLSARLVVLPGDPEAHQIEFDQACWAWLQGEHEGPAEAAKTDWGRTLRPTANAAARCLLISDDPPAWESYLAMCRHGGLDMGLRGDGATLRGNGRVFWLLRIVGRIWVALHVYSTAIARFTLSGPWECAVALVRTSGGRLGNFGAGWAEYPDPRANPHLCAAPNLLWRREVDDWPDAEGIHGLVFSLGGWIEDSWGMQCRRFLAHSGPTAGQFDWSRYR